MSHNGAMRLGEVTWLHHGDLSTGGRPKLFVARVSRRVVSTGLW